MPCGPLTSYTVSPPTLLRGDRVLVLVGREGQAGAVGIDLDLVAMRLVGGRAALLADRLAVGVVDRFPALATSTACVWSSIRHTKTALNSAHDRQQHRADDREAEDAAEHDVAGAHRLGDDRVNRLRFEIVRQAERADQQRDQQHEVGRRRQHEAEEQLARLAVAGLARTSRQTAGSRCTRPAPRSRGGESIP